MRRERFIQRLARWRMRLSADPVERAVALAAGVEGQLSLREARQLVALARDVPAGQVIVEIGSYRGRSGVALALGTELGHRCRVYAVDPHVEFRGVLGGEFGPKDQAALYANITRAGVGERVAVISLPSVTAAQAWTETNIGLLWIDGDHRYESVRADATAWHRHVVESGVIAFHDCDLADVERCMHELCADNLLVEGGRCERIHWFTRPPTEDLLL